MDLGISISLIFVPCVALRNLVDQNWLERNLSALLLKTLVVGRRQQSESIEAPLDIRRFDKPFRHWSVPLLVESHNLLPRLGSLLV